LNLNHIKGIHKWNRVAGLAQKNDRQLESYMLLEEIYEGIGITNPKAEAKAFMKDIADRREAGLLLEVSEVEWLDHLCDLEFILHGSKCKLGLTPQQDISSINIVLSANLQKLSAGQDEHGKQRKPEDFVPPETRLQAILDERI